MTEKTATLLKAPGNVTFFGLDGLYPVGDDLLAVQNGVEPQRVLRIKPGRDDTSATAEPIAVDAGTMTDLSLGFIEGDTFRFIAGSGWALFDPTPTQPPSARSVHVLGFRR
jgi:hypothetical protein